MTPSQVRLVSASTLVCTTLANPNRSTVSPIMHNAGFVHLGLDYVYVAFEPEDIAAAVLALRALDIRGSSVSKPFKEAILPFLDDLDDTARAIGAVNTVHNDRGRLVGYNSDWVGALRALREVTEIRAKRVAILGAGGAARAVAYALKEQHAAVTVFNRSVDRASRLAADLGVLSGGALSDFSPEHFDILVNATSVGFTPHSSESPLDPRQLDGHLVVLDAVFNPARTKLLDDAKQHGATTISGLRMLVHQGAFQFELFTAAEAPIEVMYAAVAEHLRV